MALRCLVWINDFTTVALRRRERKAENVSDDNIKIALCLGVSVVDVL